MRKIKQFNKIIFSVMTTFCIGAAISSASILAHTSVNLDKLGLLTRAVENDTLEQLQSKRSDFLLSLGTKHSIAVVDGLMYTWGNNDYGQLGLGNTTEKLIPTLVPNLPAGPITQVSLGAFHSAAIINNRLYTWGDNQYGQLGIGTVDQFKSTPTPVSLTGITQISLGAWHCLAIASGSLYTWGYNEFGQLGLGNAGIGTHKITPTRISLSGAITQISAGLWHSAAIINNRLYTWGDNRYGQLGLGDNTRSPSPMLVNRLPAGTITQISIRDWHSAAVVNGLMYTWGFNSNGQLGYGGTTNSPIPSQVNLQSGTITQIALGSLNSAAIVNGKLYTWGSNFYGQLGLGNTTDKHTPTLVPIQGTVTQVTLGSTHCVAIINDILYMWGSNDAGQLGTGNKIQSNSPTIVDTLNLIQKNTITLNELNDSNNIRNKIAYNLTNDNIVTILKEPKIAIQNLNPSLPIDNIFLKSRLGSTSNSNPNSGQIIVTFNNNSIKFETTLNGFKSVKLTQDMTFLNKSLPDDGIVHFANNEINQLVADAVNDPTGSSNKLAAWVKANSLFFIGDTTSEYTEYFPKLTNITKISNVNVVSGTTGTISFNIEVNKHYKQSSTNLIESDSIITLNSPITLSGFKTTTVSNPSVRTNISDLTKNINAADLLASFGDTTGTGLTNLKNYIDLSSFPTTATFKIIEPRLHETNLSFKIEATGYYDNNGILVTNSPKQYQEELTIDNLLDCQSKIEKNQSHEPTPPKVILQNIGYDSTNPAKPVNELELKKYVNLISFPSNTTYTLINVNDTNPTKLSFTVRASEWFNSSGEPQNTDFDTEIILINLDPGITTSIEVRSNYPTNFLAGDVEKSFGIDKLDGSFNKDAIDDYVVFKGEVTNNETYKIDKYNRIEGTITFDIVANETMEGGVIERTQKSFPITITGLRTIVDSKNGIFLRQNNIDNGNIISDQIIATITQDTVIAYDNLLWNKLFDVSIYPLNTTFTIDRIIHDLHGGLFSTFEILVTCSNYYENNTTMDKPAPQRKLVIDNLKYTPTSFAIKNKLPNMDPYEFFTYIGHDNITKSFNVSKLQEFITFTNFDLSNPGTTIRLIDPKIANDQITFNLEVLNYINANGIGISATPTQPIEPIPVKIYVSHIIASNTTNSGDQYPLDAILGTSIGGGIGFWLIILLISLLIQRYKNKISVDKEVPGDKFAK